jgi:hypothetical protein
LERESIYRTILRRADDAYADARGQNLGMIVSLGL